MNMSCCRAIRVPLTPEGCPAGAAGPGPRRAAAGHTLGHPQRHPRDEEAGTRQHPDDVHPIHSRADRHVPMPDRAGQPAHATGDQPADRRAAAIRRHPRPTSVAAGRAANHQCRGGRDGDHHPGSRRRPFFGDTAARPYRGGVLNAEPGCGRASGAAQRRRC